MWTLDYRNSLSLAEWAAEIGINPWIVAQVSEPAAGISRALGQCETPFFQLPYGGNQLSRNDIADAIQAAETLILKEAKTYVAPTEFTVRTAMYPRPANLAHRGNPFLSPSGRAQAINTYVGNLWYAGQWALTLLDADALITYSDPLGQGFHTDFTLTVTVPAGTTPAEIAVFLSAANRVGYPLIDCELKPVRVTISGTTATITGQAPQVIDPSLYYRYAPQALNAADTSIYVETLDVYQRTVNPLTSGLLIWDLPDCAEEPCVEIRQSACFKVLNPRGWIVPLPAAYDETLAELRYSQPAAWGAPSRVEANLVAGVARDADGKVAKRWRQIVAQLATALLPNRSCGCSMADTRIVYYRELPREAEGRALSVSQSALEAVAARFGATGRGAVRAYMALMSDEMRVFTSVTG
jgi:hypothetical protein